VTGRWFSPVSSTNKTDHHDITEILLNVALKTIAIILLISITCNVLKIPRGYVIFDCVSYLIKKNRILVILVMFKIKVDDII